MNRFLATHYFDLSAFMHAALFNDCVYVWQALRKIKDYLAKQSLGKIEVGKQPHAYLINPETISIGEGTVIEPGAYIKGPCIIGKHCEIRHGAYIRGEVIIGDHCVVGHTTELKHSILFNHAKVPHFNYVADSIVGNYVNIGAGAKCANLRLDGKEIVIRLDGEEIVTEMRKFGAIIGDHCQIGCNTVLNPGTVIGKNVQTFPGVNFGGVIEENSLIKPASKAEVQLKKG